MSFYLDRKIYDNQHHDLIIEMLAFAKDSSNTVESVFCTFCKIYPQQTGTSIRIKPEMQKLKVNQSWFDIQDIYGFSPDNNECEICCSEKKNTIFLPCKHSYACKNCAIMVRVKGNNCPICRQAISDSVIIENIG
jgi:late competence protein required for DNA uptake (superfamily II DNA/RNA helicase)